MKMQNWIIYYFYYMRSNRSETYSNNKSKFSHNFELVKNKAYSTRPNPQQLNAQIFYQSRRYDILPMPDNQRKIREKTQSYRVRRSSNKSSPRSQNGKTVYEIRNVKNTSAQLNIECESERASESEAMISHFHHRALQQNKKLTQPKSLSSSRSYQLPLQITPRKSLAIYLQKQWQMNQSTTNQQDAIKSGFIVKQQVNKKQSPLNPSIPESLTEVLQNYCYRNGNNVQLQKIPEEQIEDHNIVGMGTNNADFGYDKDLVDRLNSRTKYYRFRHNQKIKEKLVKNVGQYSNLYASKQASSSKIDNIEIKYGWAVEQIIKLIHHPGTNRVKLSIKVPKQFHHTPDSLLPSQQLKFKAIMTFEELGIIKPGFICWNQQIKVLKHYQSITFIFEKEKQETIVSHEGTPENENKYCISWYNDGSVYLGQVRADLRHGVGLEWVPGVYVYYGQYQHNFRHGYGVIKYNNMQVYMGLWAYDTYHGYGKLIDKEGWTIEQGVFRNSQIVKEGQFSELA